MLDAVEHLRGLEYPGRIIVLGRSENGDNVAVYAMTGRKPETRARKLVQKRENIYVDPIEESARSGRHNDIFFYQATNLRVRELAISNGVHTTDLPGNRNALHNLIKGLGKHTFEPDSNSTPRIGGIIEPDNAALGIVKRDESGETIRQYFEVPLVDGTGSMIYTYAEPNRDPTPSFVGEPVRISLPGYSPRATARTIYDALARSDPAQDFRIAAACIYIHPKKYYAKGAAQIEIINRVDEEKK